MSKYRINDLGVLVDNANIPVLLHHGTTRHFIEHDENRHRTTLNEKYQGDWVCYTDNQEVAWKYANAARNQNLDHDLFFSELESNLLQRLEIPGLKEKVQHLFESILKHGDEKGWEAINDFSGDYLGKDSGFGFFQDISKAEKQIGFDFNELVELLEYVEGAKKESSDSAQVLMNILNAQVDSFPHEMGVRMKKMGFNKSVPTPRVISSYIKCTNFLETSDRYEAKQAKGKYDLVIYTGEGCVDGESEFLVADPSQVLQKFHTLEERIYLSDDEYETSYKLEKRVVPYTLLVRSEEEQQLTA